MYPNLNQCGNFIATTTNVASHILSESLAIKAVFSSNLQSSNISVPWYQKNGDNGGSN